jgi:acyl-CoA thioesterase
MSDELSPQLSRRRVFGGVASAGALAAVAAVVPRLQAPAPVSADSAATPDADGRYQLTQHVRRYYQTARV